MHNDTFWYIFIFGRYSLGEPTCQLLGFQQENLNFWVHSIPLWEPYVEKPVMLSAKLQAVVYDILPSSEEGARKWCSECGSEHQCIGLLEEHCIFNIDIITTVLLQI